MFASRTLDDCKQLQVVLPRRIRAGEHLGMELVVVVVIREQAFRRAARSSSHPSASCGPSWGTHALSETGMRFQAVFLVSANLLTPGYLRPTYPVVVGTHHSRVPTIAATRCNGAADAGGALIASKPGGA